MEIIDLLDHLRHFVDYNTSQWHVIKQTTLIWRKERKNIRNMGVGKFLQNHETRHKQKWALANDIEDLETTHSLSIKTVEFNNNSNLTNT